MNNKKYISFLPYILVLGIMLLLISYGTDSSTKNFNYNEFLTQAESLTFTRAEMSMGTTVIDVTGSYKEDGKDVNFTVRVPNTEENVKYLTDIFNLLVNEGLSKKSIDTLSRYGIILSHTGKHPTTTFFNDSRYTMTFSSTPSDLNVGRQYYRQIRKLFF